ncbi:MAG: hypothetical protein JXR48_13355 [Candidatus Delongbacteria bacterium]|nr:hypothetical protein [Candidatus Delongbacteria bacterium]MBN2835942.1 hypothetical protein [Candidatus Delongbacteria bacterium]
MLILLAGPSCSGKSAIAKKLQNIFNLKVHTGRDYMRFARNISYSWNEFEKYCKSCSLSDIDKSSTVYIATQHSKFEELASIADLTIKCDAEQEVLEERFKPRTGGFLPPPVSMMIRRQKELWNNVSFDLSLDTSDGDLEKNIGKVIEKIESLRG